MVYDNDRHSVPVGKVFDKGNVPVVACIGFCGSQKIGKSWLMLKLCLCVSQGIPLWDMPTREGDVLYLCLEDTFCRIQDRLFRLTDEASGRLHFAVASDKLSDGLIVQLEDYLKEYPDSRLIVIDTLHFRAVSLVLLHIGVTSLKLIYSHEKK